MEFLTKCHSLPPADQESPTLLLPPCPSACDKKYMAVIKTTISSTALLCYTDYPNTIVKNDFFGFFLVVSKIHHSAVFGSVKKC